MRASGVNVATKEGLGGRRRVSPLLSPFSSWFSFGFVWGVEVDGCGCGFVWSLDWRCRAFLRALLVRVLVLVSTLSRPVLYNASVKVLNSEGRLLSTVRVEGGGMRTESMWYRMPLVACLSRDMMRLWKLSIRSRVMIGRTVMRWGRELVVCSVWM